MSREAETMFNVGQVTAVRNAFVLAGYDGPVKTLPVTSEDERMFVLPDSALAALRDRRALEQVLSQLLHRKVAVIADRGTKTVAFG